MWAYNGRNQVDFRLRGARAVIRTASRIYIDCTKTGLLNDRSELSDPAFGDVKSSYIQTPQLRTYSNKGSTTGCS